MFAVRRRGFAATAAPGLGAIAYGGQIPTVIGTSTGLESWQLAEGRFIPAKMVPNIIFPRPDTETNVWARNRRAPSDLEWRYRCGVQGGSFPGKWEITSNGGATGLEFIRETVPLDYHTNGLQGWGVLRWTNPVVGSYTIAIRYLDQQLTPATATFTLTVIDRESSTHFCFVDYVNGNDSNTGAYSSRKRTIGGWMGSSGSNSGKQVFLFSGTYPHTDAIAFSGTTSQQVALTSSSPQVVVGIRGESVIFDGAGKYIRYGSGSGDLWYENIQWINPHVDQDAGANSSRNQFVRTPTFNRLCAFDNHFIGTTNVASGFGSNPSCFMFEGGGATQPRYCMMADNRFEKMYEQDYGLFYDTSDVLAEGNIVVDGPGDLGSSGAAGGFFFKALRIENVTVRANVGIDQDIGHQLLYYSQFTTPTTDFRNNIEFCWNNYRNVTNKTAAEGSGSVGIGQGSGSTGNHYGNFWSYRNNMRNPHITLQGIGGGGPFTFENDVIHHSGTYTDGFFIQLSSAIPGALVKTNLATGTDLLDDATNLLTGAARDTYLYTHGCEFG